jgi:Asp/Glu/hydantoin racemase
MVFVKTETMMSDIFAEVMPDVELVNIVDDSLLPDVIAAGGITPAVQCRMTAYVKAAQETGANAVFSLCSSLGPAIDAAREEVSIPVVKIDDAMADKAVEMAERIGVVATVPTTLGPTVDLIRQKAAARAKAIEVKDALVQGAFELLMGGNKDEHDQQIYSAARELARGVEVIVFAQGSMTRLAPRTQEETGLPVLTSPRLGIEYVKRLLDSMDSKS